ncbi:unnamed protein product, partial [Rotaria magnacalcarata]
LKNDNRVVQDDHLKFDITGDTVKLVITETVPSDAGSYELIAENALGSIDCAAKLIVQ